jgi:hypothetical protein
MRRCRISRVDQLRADYSLVVFFLFFSFLYFSFLVSWIGFPSAYYGWREECMRNRAWCSKGFARIILLFMVPGKEQGPELYI